MKLLMSILLSFALVSPAFASGKLTVEPRYSVKANDWTPMIGFGVYEPVMGKSVFLNSWLGTGYSVEKNKPKEQWYNLKNSLEVRPFNRLTLGAGVGVEYTPDSKGQHWDSTLFVKVALQLW